METKKELNVERIVIDASICGTNDVIGKLKKICETKGKIILTSITIRELERMQKFADKAGADARRILAMAAIKSDCFESVSIKEIQDTPDDCIVDFCRDKDVILMTADKTMALKARMYGIQEQFLIQSINTTIKEEGVYTLFATQGVDQEISIDIDNFKINKLKSIRVISDNIEYDTGIIKLKVGDEVLIATQKYTYVSFAHYRLIKLDLVNNCEIIYQKRIYNLEKVSFLPKASYKSFLKDFMST